MSMEVFTPPSLFDCGRNRLDDPYPDCDVYKGDWTYYGVKDAAEFVYKIEKTTLQEMYPDDTIEKVRAEAFAVEKSILRTLKESNTFVKKCKSKFAHGLGGPVINWYDNQVDSSEKQKWDKLVKVFFEKFPPKCPDPETQGILWGEADTAPVAPDELIENHVEWDGSDIDTAIKFAPHMMKYQPGHDPTAPMKGDPAWDTVGGFIPIAGHDARTCNCGMEDSTEEPLKVTDFRTSHQPIGKIIFPPSTKAASIKPEPTSPPTKTVSVKPEFTHIGLQAAADLDLATILGARGTKSTSHGPDTKRKAVFSSPDGKPTELAKSLISDLALTELSISDHLNEKSPEDMSVKGDSGPAVNGAPYSKDGSAGTSSGECLPDDKPCAKDTSGSFKGKTRDGETAAERAVPTPVKDTMTVVASTPADVKSPDDPPATRYIRSSDVAKLVSNDCNSGGKNVSKGIRSLPPYPRSPEEAKKKFNKPIGSSVFPSTQKPSTRYQKLPQGVAQK